MADQKISELTALTEALSADVFPIVRSGVTYNILYSNLFAGVSKTELGYLDGVTSDLQTQLDAKASVASLSDYFNKTSDDLDDITDGSTYVKFLATERTKLSGIEALAEVNNISDVNATDLTDGGETTLHTHPGGTGTDANAVHVNVAAEISAITTKGTPVSGDYIIIEDSEDSNNKKKVAIGTLPTGGGGEANTASNQGAAGVGLFKQKTGIDLEFKNINAGSSNITITDDTGNNEIDINLATAPTITGGNITEIPSANVEIASLNLSPERTLQDFLDNKMSSGFCSGGDFTSNGDGTVSVSAGKGAIRATNVAGAGFLAFEWAANTSLSLTDNTTNYIYVDYNSGSPIISTALSQPTDYRTKVLLGKIYREGTELHLFKAGMKVSEMANNVIARLTQQGGEAARTSGAITSETGTRNVKVTAGVVWGGLTRNTTPELDTNVTGTFKYLYYNGSAWVESDATQIDNAQYNNTASGLSSLSINQYGIHWVYVGADGCVHIVYGNDSFTLAEAEAAQPPSLLPSIVTEFTFLSAKIIVKRNDTNFTEVQSAFDISFSSGTSALHNELGGLDGGAADEYYHLTDSQHTVATQAATTSLAGYLTSTDWNTFNGKLSDLVSDTSPQLGGELDAQENSIGFTLQTATGDGTTTFDFTNGNKLKFTFGGQNETFTFTAPSKPCALQLMLVQDGTGGRTVTWPATIKWPGGTAPTLSTAANAVDIISILYDGTNYYATSSLNFS